MILPDGEELDAKQWEDIVLRVAGAVGMDSSLIQVNTSVPPVQFKPIRSNLRQLEPPHLNLRMQLTPTRVPLPCHVSSQVRSCWLTWAGYEWRQAVEGGGDAGEVDDSDAEAHGVRENFAMPGWSIEGWLASLNFNAVVSQVSGVQCVGAVLSAEHRCSA